MRFFAFLMMVLIGLSGCAPSFQNEASTSTASTIPSSLLGESATFAPTISKPTLQDPTVTPAFSKSMIKDFPTSPPAPTLVLPTSEVTREPKMNKPNPIQLLIDAAVQKGESIVSIPGGAYRLDSSLFFKGMKNMTLEGNGSKFIFTIAENSNMDFAYAILIQDCENLTLRDITVDFDPLPFTQGTVIAVDPGGAWYDVKIHDGYRQDLTFLKHDIATHELSIHLFDPKTRLVKVRSSFLFPNDVTEQQPGVFRFIFSNNPDPVNHHYFAVGDYIATSSYRAVAFGLRGASNTRLDNVTIWASGGAAIDEKRGEGGTDLKIDLEPGPLPSGATVPRLWSASRDGYHVGLVRRGPVIHDSRFLSMADDMLNIHTYYFQVNKLDPSAGSLTFSAYNHGYEALFQNGDTLIAYDPVTFIEKARTKIVFVAPGKSLEVESLKGFSVGDILSSPQVSASGTIIRDSLFRNGDAGGITVKSPDTLIENNTVEHISMIGIELGVYLEFYNEGTFAAGTVIRANTLRDIGFSDLILNGSYELNGALVIGIAKKRDDLDTSLNREFKNIRLENNIIDGSTTWGLLISNARDVTVRGNQISNVVTLPAEHINYRWKAKPTSAIFIANADHITFIDNVVSALGLNADQTIVLDPSADQATIDITVFGSARNPVIDKEKSHGIGK